MSYRVVSYIALAGLLLAVPMAAAPQLDIDPAYEIETVSPVAAPNGMAWTPDGHLVVSSHRALLQPGGGPVTVPDIDRDQSGPFTGPLGGPGDAAGHLLQLAMSQDFAVSTVPLANGPRLGNGLQSMAMLEDGRLLVLGSTEGIVHVLSPGNNALRPIQVLPEGSFGRGLAVSPAGHLLVAVANRGGGEVLVFDLDQPRRNAERLSILEPGQEPLALTQGPLGDLFVAVRQADDSQAIVRILLDEKGRVAAVDSPYARLPLFGTETVQALAADSQGQLFIATRHEDGEGQILRLDADGQVHWLVRGLTDASALLTDADGRLLVAERSHQMIYRVTPQREDGPGSGGSGGGGLGGDGEVNDPAGNTQICSIDPFNASLGDQYTVQNIGDADQGFVELVGGAMRLTGDGTSLFHGDDNGFLVSQDVTGDFRFELTITDIPSDTGGDLRKGGVQVRASAAPDAARVMINYMPNFPDPAGTALQFDFRGTDGVAQELAAPVLGVSLPVSLAIDKRADVYTVYYSTDGGATWTQPTIGGVGGQVEIAMGDNLLAGAMVASYDADTTFTMEFDDVTVCQPNMDPPFSPGGGSPDCLPDVPVDLVFLLDMSGSMSHEEDDGSQRFEIARDAIRALNDFLDVQALGHRAALITFSGFRTAQENLDDGAIVRSTFTDDLMAIDALLAGLELTGAESPLPPTTPTAIGLDAALDLILADRDPTHRIALLSLSDGVPNIDRNGFGPDEYQLEEVAAISLRDDMGDFLSWGDVAWQGNFNGTLSTYDGETLANAMFGFESLVTAVPDLNIYSVGFENDGDGFGTANEDLVDYAAFVSGGASWITDATGLIGTIHSVLGELNCGLPGTAIVGDRVWADLDGDGEQDIGEPEISGVTVELVDDGGVVVDTAVTDDAGDYLFVGVAPGDYTVRVDNSTLPSGLLPTFDFDGTGTPHTAAVSLAEWEVNRLVDFGYQADGSGNPSPAGLTCFEDNFNGNGLAGWATTFVGDASIGGATESGGVLNLQSDGSALWGTDNHVFLYRSVNGDFRAEVQIDEIPVDAGGTFRKVGIVARNGFGDQAQRVMAMFVPHFPNPDRPVLQFGYRDADGNLGLELAETVYAELPVKLAIEKRDDVYTVSYSTNGGGSWVVPTGGDADGSIFLPMGDNLNVGLAAASYDAVGDFTATLDDFELCQPDATPPVEPPPVDLCVERPQDVVYLWDVSSSMTADFAGTPRFNAAQQAILDFNTALAAENDGSRAALVTFAGFNTVAENLSQGAIIHSGLTNNLGSVSSLVSAMDIADIREDATTPTALGLRKTLDLLLGYNGSERDPTIILFSDGVPNIDSMGRGPDGYELDAVQDISLLDGMGGYLSWPQVAFAGSFNGDLGTYDGEVLANAMAEIELLKATLPALRIYGVALQGDGVGLGTFNQDLLDYAAFATGGLSFSTTSASQLADALLAVGDATNCVGTAEIGDRVWRDDDGDGSQDAGEPGINGVTVELLDAFDNVVATQVTSGDGNYLFTGAVPGTWTVRVVRGTVPATLDEQTFDFDGLSSADQATTVVAADDSQLAIDFGYRTSTPPIDPPPGSQVCFEDDFEDGQLDPAWLITSIGDADQGSVLEAGGVLDLTSDGTALWGTDHHHYLYQEVEGNWRVEVDVEDIPVDAGGTFRKGGIIAKNGFGSTGQRVMVQFVPHFPNPDRPVLQFGYRDVDGGSPQLLAEVVFATLPNRIALEKVGDTYTAFYSFNGGVTWIMPTDGGAQGTVTFDMGDTLNVGLGVASYDANTTMTVRFDDYELCQPLPVPPVEPPDPIVCEPEQAIDLVIVADHSGSMTTLFPDGDTRFRAQQKAIDQMLTSLALENDGSRAALITINGSDNVTANLTSGATLQSGLTTDLAGVNNILLGIDFTDIDPDSTTTTSIALQKALEVLQEQHDPNNRPVLVVATDGIPNIDSIGQGPIGYELEEIQEIRLRDGSGQFLTWPEVAFLGGFNPDLNTRDGETLANSMFEIQRLKDTFPELLIYGVALQGDGIGLGTFNEDLLEFAAFYSGGLSFSANDSASLTGALLTLLDDTNCVLGAQIGDRVWADLDEDGEQDALEPEINGVTVTLFDDTGLAVGTAVTEGDGNYLFTGVSPGTYTVRVDTSTLPSSLQATFDLDGVGTPHEATVTVGAGDSRLDVDFGYVAPDGGDVPSDPTGVCEDDGFDDGSLGSEWFTTHVGDADQGSFVEAGGVIQLTSDGTSLYNTDNHFFVYQQANGDFRTEVDVLDIPVDAGNTFRKVGLLVKPDNNDPLSPRVMAMFLPQFPNPDRPVLQFAFRDVQGAGGQDLSDVVFAELPVRLAIQKQGDVYTVEYSLNGGDSWIRPTIGGTGGSATIEMGDNLRVGMAAASYDANVTFTAELDNFGLCQSGDQTPVDPPDPGVCNPALPLDVALVLDRSGSMTATFDAVTGENRFEASQEALRTLLDALIADDNDNRAALMSFAGFGDVQLNLNQSVTVHSGLTSDLSQVRGLVDDMDFTEINPDSTTPTALALHEVVALFQGYSRPGAQKVVVLITDGIPNIDIFGQGPIGYDLAEIQNVRLFDNLGNFKSKNEVAFTGRYNPDLGTFVGQPLADAMSEIELIRNSIPDALIYGVALQGDGVGLGTFNEDLLEYAAYYTSAASYSADNSTALIDAMLQLLDNVDCEDLP